jgi:hypothetical protein
MRAKAAMSLVGVVAGVSVLLASSTIWLLLTDPVTMADAFQAGDVTPLVTEIARALSTALQGLLAYL